MRLLLPRGHLLDHRLLVLGVEVRPPHGADPGGEGEGLVQLDHSHVIVNGAEK